MSMVQPLLSIRGLTVAFDAPKTGAPAAHVLDSVSLDVQRGHTLCLLGESGSGKSSLALAVIGLLPSAARIVAGSLRLDGTELRGLPESALRRLRGRRMGMVFQNAAACLNPLLTVEQHLREVLRMQGLRGAAAGQQAQRLLDEMGIDEPQARLRQFPHQLSGGLQQRVMIALAVAQQPDLLIADEPTSALDVRVQAQILALLTTLQRRHGMAMLFVTHDIGVATALADSVAVLRAGRVLEQGEAAQVLNHPRHPYTRSLLASDPWRQVPAGRAPGIAGQRSVQGGTA